VTGPDLVGSRAGLQRLPVNASNRPQGALNRSLYLGSQRRPAGCVSRRLLLGQVPAA
jgi:hypothetical protein